MHSSKSDPRHSSTTNKLPLTVLLAMVIILVLVFLCHNIKHIHTMSQVKELEQDNVIVRDRNDLENKLRELVNDGAGKLQVIADFDATLTKSIVDGKPTAHSLDIFARTKTLSQEYRDGCAALVAKYDPQVNDPELPDVQKQQLLNQWWTDHETLTSRENVTVADVQEATDAIATPLRDGCESMLSLLAEHQVPVVVVSAGLGEVVAHALRHFQTNIVSNFILFDEDGRIIGFTKPTVSVYNKHKIPFPMEESRHNVLLLGDSLGDCNMADSIPNTNTILRIGFFTGTDKKKLEKYRSCYDLVLVDDQTMNTVTALLKLIVATPQ